MWFVVVLRASMREGVRYSSLVGDFAQVIGELFQRQVLCLDEELLLEPSLHPSPDCQMFEHLLCGVGLSWEEGRTAPVGHAQGTWASQPKGGLL